MGKVRRIAAIILGTILVSVTPLVASADVGAKSQSSINDTALLSKVNTMMGSGTEFEDANHGGIVSFAAKMELKELIKGLGADVLTGLGLTGDKITRGQIISILARSDAGKANKGNPEVANAEDEDSDEGKEKKDKSDKLTGQARAEENRAAATAGETDEDGDDEEKGQGRDNPNRQGANSQGSASRTADGDTESTDDEPGSRGQGRGNQGR